MAVHGGIGKRAGRRLRLTSWLFICHPAISLLYISGIFLLAFLYNHPVFIITVFVFALWQTSYYCGFRYLMRKMKYPFLFCFLVALLNPVLNHRGVHILFYLLDKPVTLEAVAYGGYMLLLLLTLLTLLVSLNQIVGMGKFLYLFSGVAPQTGFIAGMSLRYSSYLKREAANYFGVQKSRSDKDVTKRTAKIKENGKLLAGFSAMILEKGLQAAESLRAKEYGKRPRTLYACYLFTAADAVLLASFLFLYIAGVALRLNGAGKLDYFHDLSGFGLTTISLCAYLSLILYILLPFFIDGIRAVRRRMA